MEAIDSNTYSFLQFISPKVQQLELQLTNVVPSGEYIFDSSKARGLECLQDCLQVLLFTLIHFLQSPAGVNGATIAPEGHRYDQTA